MQCVAGSVLRSLPISKDRTRFRWRTVRMFALLVFTFRTRLEAASLKKPIKRSESSYAGVPRFVRGSPLVPYSNV